MTDNWPVTAAPSPPAPSMPASPKMFPAAAPPGAPTALSSTLVTLAGTTNTCCMAVYA
jgi:hypothetical protein